MTHTISNRFPGSAPASAAPGVTGHTRAAHLHQDGNGATTATAANWDA